MFNMLKIISISALITLGTTASAPAFAHHEGGVQSHDKDVRGNNDDALVGGVVGALIGGVVGSEIAGRGNGTEGAVVGALVGGLAGAAIADDRNDRRFGKRSSIRYRSDYNNYGYGYNRNRYSSYYGGSSFGKFGHNRFGSRSSFGNHSSFGRHSGFSSRHGSSLRKIKKFKKFH